MYETFQQFLERKKLPSPYTHGKKVPVVHEPHAGSKDPTDAHHHIHLGNEKYPAAHLLPSHVRSGEDVASTLSRGK